MFLINDTSWAHASADSFASQRTTLAAQSRFKPFSERYGLDLQNAITMAYMAMGIRDLAVDGNIREIHIEAFNKKFINSGIKLRRKIETGSLRSGKKYALAVFEFTQEKKQIKVLLLKDYVNLTAQDREDLVKFGIKNNTDISHLGYYGLEGVWFINPDVIARTDIDTLNLAWGDTLDEEIMSSRAEKAKEFILDSLKEQVRGGYGLKGLNLGAGRGRLSTLIEKTISGIEMTSVDLVLPREKPLQPEKFLQADAHDLTVDSSSQDIIVSAFLLNYVDKHKVAKEMRRVLKNDGRAVLILHNPHSGPVSVEALDADPRPYHERIEDIKGGLSWLMKMKDAAKSGFDRRAFSALLPEKLSLYCHLDAAVTIKRWLNLTPEVADRPSNKEVVLKSIETGILYMKNRLRMTLLHGSRQNLFEDKSQIREFFEKEGFKVEKVCEIKEADGYPYAFGVVLDNNKSAIPAAARDKGSAIQNNKKPQRRDEAALWNEDRFLSEFVNNLLFSEPVIENRLKGTDYIQAIRKIVKKNPRASIVKALEGKFGDEVKEAVHQLADEFIWYAHYTGMVKDLTWNSPVVLEAVEFFRNKLKRDCIANMIIKLAEEGFISEMELPIQYDIPIRGHASASRGIHIVKEDAAALIHEAGTMMGLVHELNKDLENLYLLSKGAPSEESRIALERMTESLKLRLKEEVKTFSLDDHGPLYLNYALTIEDDSIPRNDLFASQKKKRIFSPEKFFEGLKKGTEVLLCQNGEESVGKVMRKEGSTVIIKDMATGKLYDATLFSVMSGKIKPLLPEIKAKLEAEMVVPVEAVSALIKNIGKALKEIIPLGSYQHLELTEILENLEYSKDTTRPVFFEFAQSYFRIALEEVARFTEEERELSMYAAPILSQYKAELTDSSADDILGRIQAVKESMSSRLAASADKILGNMSALHAKHLTPRQKKKIEGILLLARFDSLKCIYQKNQQQKVMSEKIFVEEAFKLVPKINQEGLINFGCRRDIRFIVPGTGFFWTQRSFLEYLKAISQYKGFSKDTVVKITLHDNDVCPITQYPADPMGQPGFLSLNLGSLNFKMPVAIKSVPYTMLRAHADSVLNKFRGNPAYNRILSEYIAKIEAVLKEKSRHLDRMLFDEIASDAITASIMGKDELAPFVIFMDHQYPINYGYHKDYGVNLRWALICRKYAELPVAIESGLALALSQKAKGYNKLTAPARINGKRHAEILKILGEFYDLFYRGNPLGINIAEELCSPISVHQLAPQDKPAIKSEKEKSSRGSCVNGLITINVNKKLQNNAFTKNEFQKARKRQGDPASDRTVYSELNGLIALGVLEIVNKNITPYQYKLTDNYKTAPPEIKQKITAIISTLPARPTDDQLADARIQIEPLLERALELEEDIRQMILPSIIHRSIYDHIDLLKSANLNPAMLERALGTAFVYVDAGCGAGRACVEAAGRYPGLKVYGVDAVEWQKEDIEKSAAGSGRVLSWDDFFKKREQLERTGRYTFVRGDITTQKFPEKADVITSYYTLQYVKDPLGALANLYNQLNLHGQLFATILLPKEGKAYDYYKQFLDNLRHSGKAYAADLLAMHDFKDCSEYMVFIGKDREGDADVGMVLKGAEKITVHAAADDSKVNIYSPIYQKSAPITNAFYKPQLPIQDNSAGPKIIICIKEFLGAYAALAINDFLKKRNIPIDVEAMLMSDKDGIVPEEVESVKNLLQRSGIKTSPVSLEVIDKNTYTVVTPFDNSKPLQICPEAYNAVGYELFKAAPLVLGKASPAQIESLRKSLGIPRGVKVIVAGSTQYGINGEDKIVLDSFAELIKTQSLNNSILILAPRYPFSTEIKDIVEYARSLKFKVKLRQEIQGVIQDKNPNVVILNTFGELTKIYALGSVAIVGNSFDEKNKGHNPLEPAVYGVPVIFGPGMWLNRKSASRLLSNNGAVEIDGSTKSLTAALIKILNAPGIQKVMGEAAAKTTDEIFKEMNAHIEEGLQSFIEVATAAGVNKDKLIHAKDDIFKAMDNLSQRLAISSAVGNLSPYIKKAIEKHLKEYKTFDTVERERYEFAVTLLHVFNKFIEISENNPQAIKINMKALFNCHMDRLEKILKNIGRDKVIENMGLNNNWLAEEIERSYNSPLGKDALPEKSESGFEGTNIVKQVFDVFGIALESLQWKQDNDGVFKTATVPLENLNCNAIKHAFFLKEKARLDGPLQVVSYKDKPVLLSKKGMKVLIMGTGIGLEARIAAMNGADVDAVDIKEMAVANTILTCSQGDVVDRVKAFKNDLFNGLGKYDLIIFNMPHILLNDEIDEKKKMNEDETLYDNVADINASLLKRTAADISSHLNENGAAILINRPSEEVTQILESNKLLSVSMPEEFKWGGWSGSAAFFVSKKPAAEELKKAVQDTVPMQPESVSGVDEDIRKISPVLSKLTNEAEHSNDREIIEKIAEILGALPESSIDRNKKLDVLAEIFSTSLANPTGVNSTVFAYVDGICRRFANELKEYQLVHPGIKELKVAMMGIGDGTQAYFGYMYAKALGINLKITGTDISQENLAKTAVLLPAAELLCIDIRNLDPPQLKWTESFDYIELSQVLHEIYSSDGLQKNGQEIFINTLKGKEAVRSVLKKCRQMLRPEGHVMIMDGAIPEDRNYTIRISMTEDAARAFEYLIQHHALICSRGRDVNKYKMDNGIYELSLSDLTHVISKLKYVIKGGIYEVDSNRARKELLQAYQYATASELTSWLDLNGLFVTKKDTFTSSYLDKFIRGHISIASGANDFPKNTLRLVAIKKTVPAQDALPNKSKSVSDGAAEAFITEFGDKAQEVLKFIAGTDDLSQIEKFECNIRKLSSRVTKFNQMLLRNSNIPITFYMTHDPSEEYDDIATKIFNKTLRLQNKASVAGLAPQAKLIKSDTRSMLVQKEAKGMSLGSYDRNSITQDMAEAVVSAIGRLHGLGMVHGDLDGQPEHIFIEEKDGSIKVRFVDFEFAYESDIEDEQLREISDVLDSFYDIAKRYLKYEIKKIEFYVAMMHIYNKALACSVADRIHTENLANPPDIPEKTILCHIITDSIVPVEQQKMLKVEVEQEMKRRAAKGEEFRERVVCLSGANTADPKEFIKDLQSKMQEEIKAYNALGYTDVQFDIACPDKNLVDVILKNNLGAKALAFEPYKGDEFTVVQAEGIITALRALHSGDIEKLKSAFTFLTGNKLSQEQLAITDIDEFIKKVTFILPATKIEDYDERRKINNLIAENIKQAA